MALSRLVLRQARTGEDATDRALESLRTDLLPLTKSPSVLTRMVTVGAATTQPAMAGSVKVFAPGDATAFLPLEAGGTNVIPHGLGRPVEGCFIVYRSSAASIWNVDVTTLSRPMDGDKYFGLAVSANVTAKVLVF